MAMWPNGAMAWCRLVQDRKTTSRSIPTFVGLARRVPVGTRFLIACWATFLGAWLFPDAVYAYYGFGKNKIHYSTHDWRELDFGTHTIYYPSGFDRIGRFAARVIDEDVEDVENLLGHIPGYKVPIILYDSHPTFLETNVIPWLLPEGVGGFTEFIKGRVVLPNTGSFFELRHVLVHEMTHAIVQDKIRREMKLHRRWRSPYIPLWFHEGLSEFASTQWTSKEEMMLGDAFLDGAIPDVDELWRLNGSYLLYCAGHSLVSFMTEQWGCGVIRDLIEVMWSVKDFDEAVKSVTGHDIEQLNVIWKSRLGQEFAYQFSLGDAEYLYVLASPKNGAFMSPAVFGSENDTLVCLSYGDGYASVYSILPDQDKTPARRLVKAGGKEGLESLHLFRSNIDVGPEGHVAFAAKAGEKDALYVIDSDNGKKIASWKFNALLSIESPSFSRDGRSLAFCAMDTSGITDLFLMYLSSGELKRLTNDVYRDASPSFSPDGKRLVFSSDRAGCGLEGCKNLFFLEIESGAIHQLTSGHFVDTDPSWSPTGMEVAFVSNRDKGQGVWITDGGRIRNAIQVKGGAFDPTWSVDGQRLYFTVYRHGRYSIYVADRLLLGRDWRKMDCEIGGGVWVEPAPDLSVAPRSYRTKYSLDLSRATMALDPALRGGGGADVLLTDTFGDNRISFHVSNSAEVLGDFLNSFNLGVSYANFRSRLNYGVGVFRLSVVDETPITGIASAERHTGAAFALGYPLSRFHRIEQSASMRLVDDYGNSPGTVELYNDFGYVRDTSIWGPEGPWDGCRVSVKVVGALDLESGTYRRQELLIDLRKYNRLSLQSTWATRVQWWASGGVKPRRFGLGGSWSLRGYGDSRMIGRKRLLLNSELRFPLFHSLTFRSPLGEIAVGPLRGALFVDAGRAWDEEFPGLTGSFGSGFRLVLGGILVLRLDIAAPTDFRSKPRKRVTQFFFGWSF